MWSARVPLPRSTGPRSAHPSHHTHFAAYHSMGGAFTMDGSLTFYSQGTRNVKDVPGYNPNGPDENFKPTREPGHACRQRCIALGAHARQACFPCRHSARLLAVVRCTSMAAMCGIAPATGVCLHTGGWRGPESARVPWWALKHGATLTFPPRAGITLSGGVHAWLPSIVAIRVQRAIL